MPIVALLAMAVAPLISLDFSGAPQVLWSGNYRVESINTRITLRPAVKPGFPRGSFLTETTMLVKTLDKPFEGRILVPRRRWGDSQSGQATWMPRLTVDKKGVPLRPVAERGSITERDSITREYSSDVAFDMSFKPTRTYVLQSWVELPIGSRGYEAKERVVGAVAGGEIVAEQFQMSFAYDQNSVFGLPTLGMGTGTMSKPAGGKMNVGYNGAFLSVPNFQLPGEPITLSYYPPAL